MAAAGPTGKANSTRVETKSKMKTKQRNVDLSISTVLQRSYQKTSFQHINRLLQWKRYPQQYGRRKYSTYADRRGSRHWYQTFWKDKALHSILLKGWQSAMWKWKSLPHNNGDIQERCKSEYEKKERNFSQLHETLAKVPHIATSTWWLHLSSRRRKTAVISTREDVTSPLRLEFYRWWVLRWFSVQCLSRSTWYDKNQTGVWCPQGGKVSCVFLPFCTVNVQDGRRREKTDESVCQVAKLKSDSAIFSNLRPCRDRNSAIIHTTALSDRLRQDESGHCVDKYRTVCTRVVVSCFRRCIRLMLSFLGRFVSVFTLWVGYTCSPIHMPSLFTHASVFLLRPFVCALVCCRVILVPPYCDSSCKCRRMSLPPLWSTKDTHSSCSSAFISEKSAFSNLSAVDSFMCWFGWASVALIRFSSIPQWNVLGWRWAGSIVS